MVIQQFSRTSVAVNTADLLHGLVRIPSPSRHENDAVSWLCDQMNDLGFTAGADEAGNAVGIIGDKNADLEIMLLGHIDTVPGAVPVEIVDGNLYGRGTVDAKGCLATFVAAAAQSQLPAGVRLRVVGAVEEEVMSSNGARWLVNHAEHPDAVVIGEPSGWDGIVLGYKGSLSFQWEMSRPMSHSAGPDMTAGQLAVDFWNSVTTWAASCNGDIPRGFKTVDATLVSMNTQTDGLYETATITANLRIPPGITPDETVSAIEFLVQDGDISFQINAPAYRCEKRSALVTSFMASMRKHGAQPRIKVKTGTSDMNLVGPVWNCPMLAYGPGDSTLDHAPNEHIPLVDLARATDILTSALEGMAAKLVKTETGASA